MIQPGLLVVFFPILVGLLFRFVGVYTNDKLLGAKSVASFMFIGSISGLLMALFFNNAGGAWDNSKKFIEMKGGKGSSAHSAAVTGDVVGDPCKDTAGPALH